MRLSKEMLKLIIKEEIQKAMLDEAETADPGLNAQSFPRTMAIVEELAKITPSIKATAIRVPGILVKIYNQTSNSYQGAEDPSSFLRTLKQVLTTQGLSKVANELESKPNSSYKFEELLGNFTGAYRKEKEAAVKSLTAPTVRTPDAAPAPQKQGMFGKMRSTFGFE